MTVGAGADDLSGAALAIAARGLGLGAPLTLLDTTTSTNDEEKRALREGAPHGAVWVAEAQTAGRGRQGRAWLAAPGEALLFSVLVRLGACPAARVPPLALVAGLAVHEAASRAVPGARFALKWPNDVVLATRSGASPGGVLRKVAGVLVETQVSEGRVAGLVIGVGINVRTRVFPEEIAEVATSLALAGEARVAHAEGADPERPLSRAAILADVLAALDRDVPRAAAKGLGFLRVRLAEVDALRGRRVASDAGAEGVAEGIDDEGRLLVRIEQTVEAWGAGEVHLLRHP
jgi:BirA family biotin operon repressor/biotin-[acetyl-CoA-carboxylase] ligase